MSVYPPKDRYGRPIQPVAPLLPDYQLIEAGESTPQVLGETGAVGDGLSHLLLVPATLNPGAVTVTDGAGSPMTVFTGGAASISTLHPFPIQIGAKSASGGWKIATGADISVIAFGDFT